MIHLDFTDRGTLYVRVSKTTARKAYDAGKTVVLCPCKLRPGAPWHPEIPIRHSAEDPETFEQRVNNFEYYNLSAETGRYTLYFLRAEDITCLRP